MKIQLNISTAKIVIGFDAAIENLVTWVARRQQTKKANVPAADGCYGE